ncbi:AP2/B3-like transcriptional factor family protein [Euphorbia peplus]|nr:AP2/B3-like transcriptional factor family protein [Euphorbia peplus]
MAAPATTEGPFRLFFKIILQGNYLRLPLRFVNLYGNELGDVAQLTVSDGQVWKLNVRREENHIFLENGFPEFVKYYSIAYGHLLTFKYQSFSSFGVHVCDKSGCEIEYPPYKSINPEQGQSSKKSKAGQRKEVEEEEIVESKEESEQSVEILGSTSARKTSDKNRKGKRKMDMSCLNRAAGVKRQHKIVLGQKFDDILSKSSQKTKSLVKAAMNMKPKNPSFLVIIMEYAIRNDVMSVPKIFANRHLKGDRTVKIRNADDGREWIVRKLLWTRHSLRLEKGLREFYRNNSLEEGDVCEFELVWMPDPVLKVSMFHTLLLD